MIQIDLTNDAPMIEPGDGDGFIHITTATNAAGEDRVIFHGDLDEDTKAEELQFVTSVRSTNRMGSHVIEYSVRERDLPGLGHYEIHCWTRRGQERHFFIAFDRVGDGQVKMVIDPKSSVCSWVTEENIFSSKTDPIEIMLSL